MLKRYFIPLLLMLAVLAAGVYFLGGRAEQHYDVRRAVPVEKFTLSNGLQVVVMPNDHVPVVTHMLVVKAGSADDPYGKSGLAHYLEHLMFAGTKKFPEGSYDKAIARIGGTKNAYTTRDYTLYFATVPSQHLPSLMTMEADRFADLEISETIAARELKVITEERVQRVENNPVAQWMEQLDALTFLNHPYRQPVIGWAEDMAQLTPADAQAFYAAYYRPSNMLLVVAGDVSPQQVRRDAQRYYGGLSSGAAVARSWPKEPPARMAREGVMRDVRVQEARLLRQYVAPSALTGDPARAMALSVLAQYLGGGDTSLLYETLVRQQKLAVSVDASYSAQTMGPAVFRVVAVPALGVSLPELEAALDRALAQLLALPPDAQAVARAKTLLRAEVIFAQDGVQPMANIMASLYAVGLDEQYFYQWAENIEAVTDAAMLAAAREVLVPARAVTGHLLPEKPVREEAAHAL